MAANEFTWSLGLRAVRMPQAVRRWLPLAAILALALVVRLPYIPDPAYKGDLIHFAQWIRTIDQQGLPNFYDADLRLGAWDRPYPPLPTLAFGALLQVYGASPEPRTALDDTTFVVLLKLLPLLAELALIGAVQIWLSDRSPRLQWLIPGALALYPGMVATTAWWGQYDAPFTLFVVLALLCLNRDRPLAAWVCFAVALLMKQPAAAIGPLLAVVTLRRHGWRVTILSMAACVGVYALATLPFALGSGLENALSPYLKASDAFPFLTNNAYNGWYALAALAKGGPVGFQDPRFSDALPLIGGLTYKTAGFLMLGGYTLLLSVLFWRQGHQRREFVWAAALYMGFFMLPTQVHERYLYPAGVLALVAVAQDRRMGWVALGLLVTSSYNVLAILVPKRWPDVTLAPGRYALSIALVNVTLFIQLTRLMFEPQPAADALPEPAASPARPTALSTQQQPTMRR